MREEIVSRLNQKCDRYVEVFGGGGWVLFHKPPGKFEVYNDFNSNLANLYRCVRDRPDELCDALRYSLNSREDFEYIRNILHRKRDGFYLTLLHIVTCRNRYLCFRKGNRHSADSVLCLKVS